MRRALCSFALTHGFGAGPLSAPGMASLLRHHDWAVRWRIDFGVPRWDALEPADIRDFCARLAAGGLLGLIDLAARVGEADRDTFAQAMAAGLGDGRSRMASLAGLLGLGSVLPQGGPEAVSSAWSRLHGAPPDPPPATRLRITTAALTGHFAFWSNLRAAVVAGAVEDGPSFNPFARENGPGPAARRLGTAGGRTATVGPKPFLRLLTAATRCVLSVGPDAVTAIVLARASGDEADRRAAAAKSRRTMAAAAILVGGLAARRGNEVTSVRRGALRDGPNGPELKMLIEKSALEQAWIPVPTLVAEAVRTLERLADAAGDADGHWLFRLRLPWGRILDIDPAGDLVAFALAEGLHEGHNALGPPLTSHQLRRAAAILFELAYRLGTPAGLARLLRHADEGSGTVYVTEASPGGIGPLRDELAAETMAAIAAISGEQASSLGRLRERLRHPPRLGCQLAAAARYGAGPLKLLDGWKAGQAESAGEGSLASLGVRVGSRLAPPASCARPLLETVRAHAAALAALGALP